MFGIWPKYRELDSKTRCQLTHNMHLDFSIFNEAKFESHIERMGRFICGQEPHKLQKAVLTNGKYLDRSKASSHREANWHEREVHNSMIEL